MAQHNIHQRQCYFSSSARICHCHRFYHITIRFNNRLLLTCATQCSDQPSNSTHVFRCPPFSKTTRNLKTTQFLRFVLTI